VVSDIRTHKKNEKVTTDLHDDSVIFLPSWDIISGFPVPKFRKKEFWKKMKFIRDEKPECILTHTRFFLQSMM
jgi:hypothetical protein